MDERDEDDATNCFTFSANVVGKCWWNIITEMDWHHIGNVVALSVASDARQFGVPILANVTSVSVSYIVCVEAVQVAEVALPAIVARTVHRRQHR